MRMPLQELSKICPLTQAVCSRELGICDGPIQFIEWDRVLDSNLNPQGNMVYEQTMCGKNLLRASILQTVIDAASAGDRMTTLLPQIEVLRALLTGLDAAGKLESDTKEAIAYQLMRGRNGEYSLCTLKIEE